MGVVMWTMTREEKEGFGGVCSACFGSADLLSLGFEVYGTACISSSRVVPVSRRFVAVCCGSEVLLILTSSASRATRVSIFFPWAGSFARAVFLDLYGVPRKR